MLLFRRKNAVRTLCFLSCLSHIAIKTYCPWHGNCKAGACKPILTFPQSTSPFHIGEQSLWKNAWPLFLWTICVTEKNARVWFFLLPLVLEEKANSPQKLWAEKRLYNTCVCVYLVWSPWSTSSFWTFMHHKEPSGRYCKLMRLRGKQQNSSCIKRLTPEQMGCFTRLTKPKA